MITTEIHTAFTLSRVLRCSPGKPTVSLVDWKLSTAPVLIIAVGTKLLAEITPRGGEYVVDFYPR